MRVLLCKGWTRPRRWRCGGAGTGIEVSCVTRIMRLRGDREHLQGLQPYVIDSADDRYDFIILYD